MLQISIVIISIVDVIGSQIGISAPFPGLATVRTRMLGDLHVLVRMFALSLWLLTIYHYDTTRSERIGSTDLKERRVWK